MKRKLIWMAVMALAISIAPTGAFAKSDSNGRQGNENSSMNEKKGNTDDGPKWKEDGKHEDEDNGHSTKLTDKKEPIPPTTVSSDTYGGKNGHDGEQGHQDNNDGEHSDRKGQGHNGYRGLFKALGQIKDKPAGAVLADLLLTQYATKLTDEQKAALKDIITKEEALSKAAELLDKQGSVTDAVYLQKEAVKANVKNVELYKKLGKLYEKTGRSGVKLYVNGDEPTSEVAPILRDGSTLVPFRAISESLKAEVSWNPEERSVTVARGQVTVKLIIDNATAYVNGKPVKLDVPPAIENGSTVVPARFIGESLNATVKWEDETQSVVIYEE